MDMPGRQELLRSYEDLADEVLIEIAQNINQEYENVAVEAARIVLHNRGTDVPDPDAELIECGGDHGMPSCNPSVGLNRSDVKLAGPLMEIPKFSADESHAIEELFISSDIPYEIHPVSGASCSSCRGDENSFHVPEKSFDEAIKIIKEYYTSLAEESSSTYFSGKCPACGTEVLNVKECTDCGLSLVVDVSESLEKHPFMMFLKSNDMMP